MNDFPDGCTCPHSETRGVFGMVIRIDRVQDESCPVHGGHHEIKSQWAGKDNIPDGISCACGWLGTPGAYATHKAIFDRKETK